MQTEAARRIVDFGFGWEGLRRAAKTRFGRRHDVTLAGLLKADSPGPARDWPAAI